MAYFYFYNYFDLIFKVTVKAKMSNPNASGKEALQKEVITTLRQLLVTNLVDLHYFMNLCYLNNTELMKIQRDKSSEDNKDIALWFWCKSETDLRRLEHNCDIFMPLFTQQIHRLSLELHATTDTSSQVPVNDTSIRSTAEIADARQFQKDVCEFESTKNFLTH